jgi:hypothetical protein
MTMLSNSLSFLPRHRASPIDVLRKGVLIGAAGGLAEVVVVSLSGTATGVDIETVGRYVASAVRLDAGSAWTGLAVHMCLAIVLGVAIMFAWNLVKSRKSGMVALYSFMMATLAVVWAINFFVALPVVSPAFVTLLPLGLTFLSKLMFGCAAAMTLHAMSRCDAITTDISVCIRPASISISVS